MSGLRRGSLFIGVLLACLILGAALLTWIERRLLACWQDRYGPNRAGPFGMLQAVADVIKILLKEDWIPPLADKPVFVLAPAIVIVDDAARVRRRAVRAGLHVANLNIGLLFFLAHDLAVGLQRRRSAAGPRTTTTRCSGACAPRRR